MPSLPRPRCWKYDPRLAEEQRGSVMAESFGAMLRRHRVESGFTQEALAEKAAISATAIAALERGRRRAPRLSTLRQLARAMDLSPDQLAELAGAADAELRSAGHGETGPHQNRVRGSASYLTESSGSDNAGRGAPDRLPVQKSQLALPDGIKRRWRAELVGRGRELASLTESWKLRRRFNVVFGESGVGKTRLLSSFARLVHDDGGSVVWGWCSEERLGPYAPFVEILRQVVNGTDVDLLTDAVSNRGELVRLVPEIERKIGRLPAPTRAESGIEQRLLSNPSPPCSDPSLRFWSSSTTSIGPTTRPWSCWPTWSRAIRPTS